MTIPARPSAALLLMIGLWILAPMCQAQVWHALGPSGGDVHALAVDPQNPQVVYLGTTDGHIFGSRDSGEHWQLLGRAGNSREAVVTSILVSPQNSNTIYASTWTREARGEGGGVFVSHDGGADWESLGLAGHAVRALVAAPSNSSELVAGALDGVFLSSGSGAHWLRISPANDRELQNVDSIAIDPHNPQIIYVGTFHLPWKTLDGGRHWVAIHSGMIDDSDVFSIAVDRTQPQRIFASACTGIYRSDNAGGQWTSIQGIPSSARRTHVVIQDPANPKIVYAGTTEGLWKTGDAGKSWKLVTPANWVVNALLVIPGSGRMVMGTDQLGVLLSDDGGEFFRVSNDGFNHRQIQALVFDPLHPGRGLAVLANAPETILETNDGGETWFPTGARLRAEDVRKVFASPVGWLAALEQGGLERYDVSRREWFHEDGILPAHSGNLTGSVPVFNDMAFTRAGWFAAMSAGLYVSRDAGRSWQPIRFFAKPLPVSSVLTWDGVHISMAASDCVFYSFNAGQTWRRRRLPQGAGPISQIAFAASRTILAAAQNGLYVSRDSGVSWILAAHGIPAAHPQNISISGKVWIAAMRDGGLYTSENQGYSWTRLPGSFADDDFTMVSAAPSANGIFAASSTDGLYLLNFDAEPTPVSASGTSRR
jgi:photosystem II stability/assembly factor-like uncharacterized protein